VVTHNFLGPVLTAAAVHLDIAIPNFLVQEYSKVDEGPQSGIFVGTLPRQGGYLPAPTAPGLGIRLDDERVAALPAHERAPLPVPRRADGSVAYSV
jgi:galactonate dehydratase